MPDPTPAKDPTGALAFPSSLAIKELIGHGAASTGKIIVSGKRRPSVIIPDGYQLAPLPPEEPDYFEPAPDHIRQTVKLLDAQSFVDYVKLFKTANSRIFASPLNVATARSGGTPAEFLAVLDYHEPGAEQKAARGVHLAQYPMPISVELQTWLGKDTAAQKQDDFVSFVDRNGADIKHPNSATLMEMALNFESTTTVTFQSKITRQSGNRVLTYKEEDATAGEKKITVPEEMTLSLPIFEGGKKFDVKARIEYRASSGKLTIAYFIQRLNDVLREAFKTVRAEIEDAEQGAGIPVLTGSPE